MAAVIGIVGFIYDALRVPDIDMDSQIEPASPLASFVHVKNNSLWFAMRRASINCFVDATFTNGASIQRARLFPNQHADIESRATGTYRCRLTGGIPSAIDVPPGIGVVSAHILITTEYTTLFFPRSSEATEFTWPEGLKPPHWVKGQIVDPFKARN